MEESMGADGRYLSATCQRIPKTMANEATEIASRIKESKDERAVMGTPSRDSVVRLALRRGLDSLQKEYPPVAGGVAD